MGRTEFPDLRLIGSEPLVGYGTFSNRAKWGALRSARISTLKKDLTPPTLSEMPDDLMIAPGSHNHPVL